MTALSPRQAVQLIILVATAVRLALAATIGLGVDECYAVAVSRSLSWSYFDHPPLHFWLVWLITNLTGSEHPIIVRLPFILLFAGTTWLMFVLTGRLFGDRAGCYAALLLNISAVFGLSGGGWVLPDGPLLFCILAATILLERILFSPSPRHGLMLWLCCGVWLGLGLLSKYHTLLLIAGLGTFLLTSKNHRPLLLSIGPYLAVFTALAVFSPVIIWNYQHDWVSFLFQGSRGGFSGFYPAKMLANIIGQAIWILPWIWLPLLWVFVKAVSGGPADPQQNITQKRRWFLCCLAAGPILLFTLATLWGAQGLFHWQSPGYLLLFPLLGAATAAGVSAGSPYVNYWLRISTVSFLLILVLLGTHTATGWLAALFPGLAKSGDPTLEALSWHSAVSELTRQHLIPASVKFVVAPHWIDAGKIDYALGGALPVLCLSDAPHHFAFMHPPAGFTGGDALIIGTANRLGDAALYRPYFDSILPLGTVAVKRGGRDEIRLVLFHARNFHGRFPLPYGQQR